jgi:hypothetical protein
MENLTFIILASGERKLIHEGSLYSDHLAIFKAVLENRPKDVVGVQVWRSMRGLVKSKTFTAAKNGKDLSEVLAGVEIHAGKNRDLAPPIPVIPSPEQSEDGDAAADQAAADQAAADQAAADQAAADQAAADQAAADGKSTDTKKGKK